MSISTHIKNAIKTVLPAGLLTHRLPRRLSNAVLLTFDDGPDPELTPLILARLKQYKACAVFFVVGSKVDQHPDLLRQIVADGHLIGAHTYSHPNRVIASPWEYRREMAACQAVIKKVTGLTPHLFRPPLGLSIAALLVAGVLRKRTMLWSIESGEWGVHKHETADAISNRLTRELAGRDIVLMHDNSVKVITVLDTILPLLKEKGIDLAIGTQALS